MNCIVNIANCLTIILKIVGSKVTITSISISIIVVIAITIIGISC